MRVRQLVQRVRKACRGRAAQTTSQPGRTVASAATRGDDGRRYVLEAMEPRLLLSAAPFFSAADAAAGLAMTLSVDDRQGVQTVVLRDAQDRELAATALAGLQGPLQITGSAFDDQLRLATGSAALDLRFDGGGGRDSLAGTSADTAWRVDGSDQGTLQAGALQARFTGVETLLGASGNRDQFTLAAAGSLSGSLDGGAAGFDTLVFEATAVMRAIYAAFGPDSGTVQHDARLTRYAGLEPIIDDTTVADRVFSATDGDDTIRVLLDASGAVTISSENSTPTFESLRFQAAGLNSLTLNTGAGSDTLRLSLLRALPGGLTVNAGDTLTIGQIDTDANVTVSAGSRIATTPRAFLSAGSGDLTLQVRNTAELNWAQGLAGFKDKQTSASIAIDGATLLGRNITLDAQASTAKLAEVETSLTPDVTAQVLADFNSDGRVDLVQGDSEGALQLYLNNGSATPFDGVDSQRLGRTALGDALPIATTALSAGDVDADGDIDLLVGTADGRPLLLLNNGGAQTPFGTQVPLEVGLAPTGDDPETPRWGRTVGVALADADGDGRLDAFIARTGGAAGVASHVYLNDGSAGVFSSERRDIGRGDASVTALAVGDVDGDGRNDVVLGRSSGGAQLYLNLGPTQLYGQGSSAVPLTLGATDAAITAVAIADLSGDGRRDLLLASSNHALQLAEQPATPGQVSLLAVDTGPTDLQATALAVGDVDGDGRADMVLGSATQAGRVLLNTGQAGAARFGGTPLAVDSADVVSPTAAVSLADLDRDGRLDLVQGNALALSQVYRNTGPASASQSPFVGTDSSIVNPDSSLVQRVEESSFFNFNAFGAVLQSQADASVTLDNRSTVVAGGNLAVRATALAQAKNSTIGLGLGVTHATVTSNATARLGENANVQAGGAVTVQADTVNLMTTSALAISPTLANLSLAFGTLVTDASATVADTARITSRSLSVLAGNDNTISTGASGFNLAGDFGGPSSAVAAGFGLAIGNYSSSATATLGGTVRTSGDVTVQTHSIDRENTTSASASVLNPPTKLAGLGGLDQKIAGGLSKLADKALSLSPKLSSFLGKAGDAIQAGETPSVSLAGSLNLHTSKHVATATINAAAVVTAGGKLDLDARAEDAVRAYATGSASDSESVSVGGAASVAKVDNTATASIGAGATVDVAGALHVLANAVIPNPVKSTLPALQFTPPEDTTGVPNSRPEDRLRNGFSDAQASASGVGNVISNGVVPFITGILLGDVKTVGTTYAQGSGSTKSGGTAGIGGSVNITQVANNASASIGRNARINQTTPASAGQSVQVEALSTLVTIDLSGQASALSIKGQFGSGSASVGVGGNFTSTTHFGRTQAFIDDGALVSAGGDITVNANSLDYLMQLAVQGQNAGSAGVSGTVTFADVDQRTEAWVEDGATVRAGRDLAVQAGSTLALFNADGALARGDAAGVGAGVAVSIVRDHTARAFLGDANGVAGSATAQVVAGRDLNVTAATQQQVWSLAAAGGVATNGSDKPKPSGPELSALLRSPGFDLAELQKATEGKRFGFGVGGAVAVTQLAGGAEAFVDRRGDVSAARTLKVDAQDDSTLVQAAGAFGVGRDAGIGGSASALDFDRHAHAYLQGGGAVSAGMLQVTADSQELVVGVAAGAAGAKESAAVAGSVVVGLIDSDTQVWTRNTAVTTTGDVTLDAGHARTQYSVAGAVAVGLSTQAAVGAAVAAELGQTTVRAEQAGTLRANGAVAVQAHDDETVRVVGAALAASATSGVGASGSAAAHAATHVVQAQVSGSLTALGAVRIDADDTTDRLVIAGAVGGGQSAGVGLSVGLAKLDRTVQAGVAPQVSVSAGNVGTTTLADPQGGTAGGSGLTIEATSSDRLLLGAIGGAGGSNVGIAASAAVSLLDSRTEATVGAGARVAVIDYGTGRPAPGITIRAHDSLDTIALGGSVAGSGNAGVGAVAVAVDQALINRAGVASTIDLPTRVLAAGSMVVDAGVSDALVAVAASAAGGGAGAGAGSVTVVTRSTDTQAWLGDRVNVDVGGSLAVGADSELRTDAAAGGAAVGGKAGVGASNTTVLDTSTTRAFVGALATVAVRGGSASALAVPNGSRDANGRRLTTPVAGLSVAATHRDLLRPLTLGVGGGGAAGVAASVSYSGLDNTTEAWIGGSANVTAAQDIQLLASDDTDIASGTGGAGGGGVAGVGAGADAGTLRKTTRAFLAAPDALSVFGTRLTATAGDVRIRALSTETVLSAGAAGGFSGTAGVAGSTSVWLIDTRTHALVANLARVDANGNVQVAADDRSQLTQAAGSVGAGGGLGIGAAVGASTLTKDTLASVGSEATVNARANTAALQVANGRFDTTAAGATGGVSLPTVSNADLVSSDGSGRLPALLARQWVAPATDAFQGLAVTAVSRESVVAAAASAGGGGTASVQVAGAGHRSSVSTRALLADRVAVNSANTGAGAAQSVRVLAADSAFHLGIGGSAGSAGAVAVSPGVDAVVLQHATTATVGDGSSITARQDLQVQARAEQNLLSITAGVAGAGTAAVSGAISALVLDNRTQAVLGSSAAAATGPVVRVGGNAEVVARDDTRAGVLAGAGAIGGTGGGFSASVGFTQITKDTQALIGRNAVIDALGNSSRSLSTAPEGSTLVGTQINPRAFTGVQVAADSSEQLFNIGVAGAGGLSAGLAGAVNAALVQSGTAALVAQGARINQSNTGAAATQAVAVRATNGVASFSGAGALAVGIAGLGGGVDVTVLRNDTSAEIAGNTQVAARGDVSVNAVALRDIQTQGASAAGGAVGVAGGVSVLAIGSALDSQALRALQANDSGNSNNAGSDLDSRANGSQVNQALTVFKAPEADSSADASRRLAGLAGQMNTALSASSGAGASTVLTGAAKGGTRSSIGSGAQVLAGGDISVQAREQQTLKQLAGSAALGFVSVGGAVAVTNVATPVSATVADSAAGSTATRLQAGGGVVVQAALDQRFNGAAYGGAAGGLASLGAQVVAFGDASSQTAAIGNRAQVAQAAYLLVEAGAQRSLAGDATGGAGAPIAANGAVVSHSVTSNTIARIGDGAAIGQEAGRSVGFTYVAATTSTTATAATKAVAVAVAGGSGADSRISIDTDTQAWVGNDARITSTDAVTVLATARQDGKTSAEGINGGVLLVGVNLARGSIDQTVSAQLRDGSAVRAAGDVAVQAVSQVRSTDTATASGGSLIGGVGGVASSTIKQTVLAELGTGAVVRTGGQLRVGTDVGSLPLAQALDGGFSFASAGSSRADVQLSVSNIARLGVFSAVAATGAATVQALTASAYDNGQGSVFGPAQPSTANARLGNAATVHLNATADTNVIVEQLASLLAGGPVTLSASGGIELAGDANSPVRLVPPLAGAVTVVSTTNNSRAVRVQDNAVVESAGVLRMAATGSSRITNTASGGLAGFGPLTQTDTAVVASEVFAAAGSRLAAQQMELVATGGFTSNRGIAAQSQRHQVRIDGSLFKFGAQDRQLLVDADGSINARSNMAATVAANGTVTAAALAPTTGGQPLTVTVSTGASGTGGTGASVGGSGVLQVNNVLRSVTVNHNAPAGLVLGSINAALSAAQAAPVVRVNGAVVASPWTLGAPTTGTLTVNANGGGALTLNGNIDARGTVLLATRDAASTGQDIRVGNNVKVTSSSGAVTVSAGDDIVLGVLSTLESSNGSLRLEVDAGNADAGTGGTLNLAPAADVLGLQRVEIVGNGDADSVTVGQQRLGTQRTDITLLGGNDSLVLGWTDADPNLRIDLGEGDDTAILGRQTDVLGNRRLADIRANLTLVGGGGTDTLVLGDSANTAATSARLGETSFSGGGLAAAALVNFSGLEAINLQLGSGADTLEVNLPTQRIAVSVSGGGGADTVSLLAHAERFAFNGGDGNDSLLLGSRQPASGGVMAGLRAAVSFNGEAGSDRLVLDDAGNTAATRTTLGNGLIQGWNLGSANAISFGTVEDLQITLGSGNDVVQVNSTTPGTRTVINGGPGNDSVTGTLGGVTVNAGAQALPASAAGRVAGLAAEPGAAAATTDGADAAAGRATGSAVGTAALRASLAAASRSPAVQQAAAAATSPLLDQLEFNGGDGIDQLRLDDSSQPRSTALTITSTAITGTGLGSIGVRYSSIEGLDLAPGTGGSSYNVVSSVAGLQLKLYGSAGDDDLTIAPTAADIVFDAGAGNDTVRIGEPNRLKGLTGKVTVIGGAGHDTLIGSSADNVLYGDGVDGEAATDGDDIIVGGLGRDTIAAGGGNDLVFGDLGRLKADEAWCAGRLPDELEIETVSEGLGGDDSIRAGSGDDLVFGGAGNDTLDLGEGRNIGFGDNGQVEFERGRIAEIETSAEGIGGNDVLKAGSGNDLLFGGAGADRIDAGAGHNLLFGGGGELTFRNGVLVEIEGWRQALGGADTLVAGSGNDLVFLGTRSDVVQTGGGSDRVLGNGEIDKPGDPALVEWNRSFAAAASTTADTSRQAQWLKSALAGRSLSPWSVAGGPNASLQLSLPISAGSSAADSGGAAVTAAAAVIAGS